jgi:peptide/nickel transport system substrate-binding protein
MRTRHALACAVVLLAVAFPSISPSLEAATPKNTVVVAMGGDYFDGIDPVTSGFFLSNEFQILTHERLVDYVHVTLPDGRKLADPQQPRGGLAESFQLSPDKRSFTFRLRRGHRFANGDPVTAHAVKYSFARMLEVPGIGKFGLTRVLRIESAEQMIVADDHTIRFDLKDPNPIFVLALTLNNFGIINPKEVEARKTEKDPQAREWMKVNSTGSGPYVLEGWKPGAELTFRANPNYRGGKPAIERVIYKVVPSEQDRILLLKSGDVDVAYNLSERNVVALKGDRNITVTSFETVGKEFLFMNPALQPFTDKRVRQAVNYAVSKDAIVKSVFMGLALPLSSPIPKGMAHHKPIPPYPHDPERAKKLLAEAGYPNGFSVELAYRIGYPAHEEAAVYIQADLAKVGVTVKPEKIPPATFTERARKNQLPFGFSNFVPYVNHPAYHTYWQYHGDSGFNWSRFNNPTVNELINRAQIELGSDAQRDLFTRIQDMVHDESPEVLLVQPLFNMVTRKNLKNFVFYPDRLTRWDLMAKD